ncbi:MAG: Fe-S cluster protein, partial [Odoribacter sp.]|nr:Fe-S cluster protein [Odoribacter sp.]
MQKIRNGIPFAKKILQENQKVILSLAPSYVSEFHDISLPSLISAIKKLGFTGISETALGTELVSDKVSQYLNNAASGIYISSACPVVLEYIRKYGHSYISNITPVFSPLLAHTKLLKHLYGEDVKIIFAGPCIGKKLEADTYRNLLGVAITFQDLKKWFEEENIDLEEDNFTNIEDNFIPYRAGISTLYPIEGGMLPGIQPKERKVIKMAFSGMEHIKEVLYQLETQSQKDVLFLELLACKGGCINGPGKLSYTSPALKRYDITDKTTYEQNNQTFEEIDLTVYYQEDKRIKKEEFSDDEILQAMSRVGKTCVGDELNCSGCGYDSCRDFATALLAGRAEENMCLSYMRKVAHDKAIALLQKIPIGVFIIDGDMKIVDMNFAGAKT